MKLLINYANHRFIESQRLNSKTGIYIAGFDKVVSYGPADIDLDFKRKNHIILSNKKGDGYWLWKPYIIVKTLSIIDYGDFLFYSDSGAYFIRSIKPLIDLCSDKGLDIIAFELPYIEKHYTKRDAFILMGCDSYEFTDTRQRSASFILVKKSDFVIKFFNEFLMYAQDPRIITDKINQIGKSNYPGFISHRHDQSIFSLLTKKYRLKGFRMPTQLGSYFFQEYPDSKYGELIFHSRRGKYSLRRRAYIEYLILKSRIINFINIIK